MNNILKFDEYNISLLLSEGILTIEFIDLLIDEEKRIENVCEGFSFAKRKEDGDWERITSFTPGKHDTEDVNTKIFSKDKTKFAYHIQKLEKSDIDSYNLYKFGSDIRISKMLKHPEEYKLGKFDKSGNTTKIDNESIDKFFKRSALYIRSIIKELNFDVDIITYPKSSSKFNEILTEYVMEGYENISSIKIIPNLFTKDIQTIKVNRNRAKEIGMTDEEINKLEKEVINWKNDYEYIYPLRVELDSLKDELAMYIAGFEGKRGRRPNAFKELLSLIKQKEQEIKDKRSELGRRGKDRTKSKDGKARGFEIKSLPNDKRKAIENLFTINKDLDTPNGKSIEDRLKGKNIVIFDDNISSGATLDDMCVSLQKCGVNKILPITMAIIKPTSYGYHDDSEYRKK